jgi:PAS domain S-box-containing protein
LSTIAGIIRCPVTRHLAAAIAVVLALLLRVALERQSITLPTYVTFYPVVFLAAILGDIWTGLLATALSALLADYFLLPPVGQFAVHSTSDIVGLAIFSISGVSVSVVVELDRRRREKLAASAIESAILSERGNVEEAQESTASPGINPFSRIFNVAGRGSRFPGLHEKRFRASLRRAVLVPFMAALIIAGAALWAAYEANASMQWVDHTNQVIGQSQRLFKLLADMETGERGYLVTGNDAFLQPYHEASKVIDSEYQKLYLLVADDPSQQTRLESLHVSLNHWRGYAEQMIALRRTGGAYTDLQINLAGKAEVDEIRDQIGGFQSVEEHLRDERNRTAQRDWRLEATICILLGLGIGAWLAVFTFRRMEMVAASFEESGRALAASEQRWATTLESIGDAVMATDSEGRVTFLNQTAAALTGWQSEDALGQPIQNVFCIVNEQTRRPAEDPVDRVLNGGRAVELANNMALLAKNGRLIPIADSAAPIVDRDGRITGVVLVFHDVTENRRAEEAVRESQAKLAAALASMTDSVIITDADGRFVDFNDSYARFYRFKSKAECAQNFDEFTTLFDVKMADGRPAPREMYAIQRALRGETATNVDYTLRRKDTGETWVGSLSFGPIRDKDGAIIGSVLTSRDITKAKRAEQALRESEEQFRNLANAIPQLCWMANADGGIFWYNQRWYQYTGTTPEQMKGWGWKSVHDPDALPGVLERWTASIGTGQPFDMVFPLRGADGLFRIFLTRVIPIKGPDGKVARWFGTNTDITDIKQAEEALRSSQEQLQAIIDGAPDTVVFLKDIDGRFITVNSRFEELLGITRDDVRGKTDYDILTRERADYYRAHDQQILTTGQPMQIEELALLADGKEHTFLANKFPLFDASGKPYAVCAISVDITERKRVEEALRASELRFRLALTNAPVSVAMQDCDLVYRWAYNQRTRTPEEIIGKTDADLFAPAEIPAILKVKRRVLRTGAPEHVQQWITSDGQRLFADLYYEPLRGGDGEIVGLGIAVVDLTRRKLAEEQIDKLSRILKARSQSDQAILHATDEQTFLEEVCRIITLDCGHSMVWIGVAEHDEHKGVRPVAYSGFAEGYLETQGITWDESERGRGPTGTAIRTGRPSMCRNMLTDPAFAPWRDDAVEHGYASSLVIPLKDENKAWGAITIYSREPDSFSKGEVDLLVELAKDLEFGIQTLRMRAAHARAEQLLRENEKLLGLFIEHAPAALAMFDRHMRYLHASRRWREDYNLGDRNLSGISHYDVIPEMPEAWKNAHRRGLAGEVLYGDAERFERADGSVQWIRWEIRPWLNAEGAVGGIVIFSEDITRHKEADAALMQGERLAVQHEQLRSRWT